MQIWGDARGQAAVLGLGVAAQGKAVSSARQIAADSAPVAEARAARATQHCCFHCSSCDVIIALPHDCLGLMFAGPAVRRVNVRSIATACPSCRHVAGYSLFRGGFGYDTRHKLTVVKPVGTTALVDWLRCEEESCAYPLPLFITSEAEVTGDSIKDLARSWAWEDLTCVSGHPIRLPIWVSDMAPHQFPAQLAAR